MLEEIIVNCLAIFSGKNPVHIAAKRGYVSVLKTLLNKEEAANIEVKQIDIPDKKGRTPLHLATLGGHKDTIAFLLEAQANTQVITKDGFQPFHFAALKDSPEIIECFLQAGANIYEPNVNSRLTFLHIAIKYNSLNSIKMLFDKNLASFSEVIELAIHFGSAKVIQYLQTHQETLDANFKWSDELKEKVRIFLKLNATETILYADHFNNFEIRQIIADQSSSQLYKRVLSSFKLFYWKLKLSITPIPSYIYSYEEMQKFYKDRRDLIKKQPPLESIVEDIKPSPRMAICSRTFYEEFNAEHAKILKQRTEKCSNYANAPLIAPFIYFLALAAMGKCSQKQQQSDSSYKKLKILLTNSPDLARIKGFLYINIKGVCSKNTLFHSSSNIYSSAASIGGIFHEGAHFAAKQIIKNNGNPYRLEDTLAKNLYQKIVKETKAACDNWQFNSSAEYQVIANFKSIFNNYPESEYEAELFVKIAETIGLLGYKKGYEWLQTHTPNLLAFYETYFNPACMDYLKTHEAWKYIELDPAFQAALLSENQAPNHVETVDTDSQHHPSPLKKEYQPVPEPVTSQLSDSISIVLK